MKNVYILCEGQTEERFVTDVLYNFFISRSIYIKPIIIETKKTINYKYKGGVLSYKQIKNDLIVLCKQHPHEIVTTIIDYYALPIETPGTENNIFNLFDRISFIEKAVQADVGCTNLVFYLCVHEFEALLFSNSNAFEIITDNSTIERLLQIRNSFISPEHINNSPITAPSKRIISVIPTYSKVLHGSLIANRIGLNKIREECYHFNEWIDKIITR